MNTDTKVFLKKRFKDYYWNHQVAAPKETHRREFGVGTLEDKIKFRHKAFATEKEMNQYLKTEAPYYISYSTAYYEYPAQPMAEKGWLGADLVFDLDKTMELLCRKSLEEVKSEAAGVVSFLMDDFGFDMEDISVNFSGSKGYHIHVGSEDVRPLNADARREIVDYVSGSGIELEYFIREEGGHGGITYKWGKPHATAGARVGPMEDSTGWAGRIFDVTTRLINLSEDELAAIDGVGRKTAKKLAANREANLRFLKEGRWDPLWDQFKEGLRKQIYSRAVSIKDADRQVTLDTSRLIRLPDTIHGGSGLLAKKVTDLDRFDPLTDAVAFRGGSVRVKVSRETGVFQLNGLNWGPYREGETVEAGEAAAVYLMLKDRADFISVKY